MPRRNGSTKFGQSWIWTSLLIWLGALGVRADEIVLRGGGRIQGVVVGDPDRPEYVQVYTATGANPYSFRKEQVEKVVPGPTPLTEYLQRKARLSESAEDHHELGLWAEEQGLSGPAKVHFRRAVELDDAYGPAQEKLGRVLHDGRWMSFAEVRQSQGLVQHEGRWMTREQMEGIQARQEHSAEQESWARNIQLMVRKLQTGTTEDQAKVREQLLEIRDPKAIAPLMEILSKQGLELRRLLSEILGAIPEPEATAALVYRVLNEEDLQVRQSTLNELFRRQDPTIVDRLRRVVKDEKNPQIVGRAAWALAALGAESAIPDLIPKLVSVQQRVEMVPVQMPAPSSGGGMGIGATFQRSPSGPGGIRYGGPSVAVPIGPVVAPGAIAFGAASVPAAAFAPGFPIGTLQPPPTHVRMQPRKVSYPHQNVEVLAALEKLTGRNLGYNSDAWRRWLRDEFQVQIRQEPVRRVPQP
ncbi:hypothetical protein BH23PLA1_BH23PLA1_17960 [soil metagenome]